MTGGREVIPAEPAGGRVGLVERLLATVRPEFRGDELAFDPADPVFGGELCAVDGCGRTARGQGLCTGHYSRWLDAGQPDLELFATSTDPRWRRQRPLAPCRAPGCGRGLAGAGLCGRHARAWKIAGRPELTGWLQQIPVTAVPPDQRICPLAACQVWAEPNQPFCRGHSWTWRRHGRPDVEQFIQDRDTDDPSVPSERIHLHALPPHLKLEMQYVLQQLHDERQRKVQPRFVMRVVRLLAGAQVTSLLDADEDIWRDRGRAAFKDTHTRGLLNYAYRQVLELVEAGGWDAEYGREVWQLGRLGFDGRRTIRFAGVSQPWLKDLVKRWARWRLSTGLSVTHVQRSVLSAARLSRFLVTAQVDDITGVDRLLLERYLADLHAERAGKRHAEHLGHLNSLFGAIRQWDDRLPATAAFFHDDYPATIERLPRALSEHVMAQIEHPDQLARWRNPAYQLITIILIRCGLRVSDASRLENDCLTYDADGAPYLRYLNHKMKRQALVPIDEELRRLIDEQQQRVLQRWPAGSPWLFPRPKRNIDAKAPIAGSTYRLALPRWLADCDVRDEHGRPVHLTPHQWRHTLGTRLINRDVPQEVVRRILDHASPQMTAHYARLHDTTIRRHWENARKVNINGETVTIDPNGPLAEAAWAKQRLSRATQALPNGYCGLPVQQSCPHANACLSCPMFITTVEFLPQHRNQRRQTLEIIDLAHQRGQTRLAEMNQQVAANLEKIIAALENPPGDERATETADAS